MDTSCLWHTQVCPCHPRLTPDETRSSVVRKAVWGPTHLSIPSQWFLLGTQGVRDPCVLIGQAVQRQPLAPQSCMYLRDSLLEGFKVGESKHT